MIYFYKKEAFVKYVLETTEADIRICVLDSALISYGKFVWIGFIWFGLDSFFVDFAHLV